MIASSRQLVAKGHLESAGDDSQAPTVKAGSRRILRNDRADRHILRLASIIEAEVIPRLVLARRMVADPDAADERDGPTPSQADVTELADLVLARDVTVASAYVEAMRTRGISVETLYLDLMAPAAQHLGELWNQDLCDFTQVTVGLGRLQGMLHELSPAFQVDHEQRSNGLRALLVPAPGDQHTFGLSMVAEFFRRAGWDVWGQSPMSRHDLIDAVRNEWFAMVGLSVSCGTRLEALASCVRAIRRTSRNRAVGILVGGPAFTEDPALAKFVGADATAPDGRQAAIQAQNLLSLLVRRR